jgi:hypothetical protein
MIRYDNWFFPTTQDLRFEHETEWDKMRMFLGTSFFDDEQRMVDLIEKYGKAKRLNKAADQKLSRRTYADSIEEVEDMVSSYRSAARRKGVPTKLAEMFQNGDPLPMPLVMQRRARGFIVGGNTRLNIAEIVGVTPDPKVVYVNLDLPEVAEMLDNYPLTRLRGM